MYLFSKTWIKYLFIFECHEKNLEFHSDYLNWFIRILMLHLALLLMCFIFKYFSSRKIRNSKKTFKANMMKLTFGPLNKSN